MVDEKIERWFPKHTDGRQKCSKCGRSIPKYIRRISFGYRTSYRNNGYFRICEACISELATVINKDNIEKWQMEIFKEAI